MPFTSLCRFEIQTNYKKKQKHFLSTRRLQVSLRREAGLQLILMPDRMYKKAL